MHSGNVLRRVRRSGIKFMQSPLASLEKKIYEGESDSGVDESEEENQKFSKPSTPVQTFDIFNNMRAYDSELEKNIEFLEEEIIECCDELIRTVERRRNTLLTMVQDIREDKLKCLKNEPQELSQIYTDMLTGFSKTDIDLGNCLRFVTDDNLLNLIEEYGTIDEGRASAEKSKASGIGLKYGISNETTQFELETYSNSGELSWVEQDKINVVIKRGNKEYPCVVQNKCNGIYVILYELQEPGQYEIHVEVNGRHITQSPFLCDIFEKCDLKFLDTAANPEWTFQSGDNSALVEKTEIQRTSKLYSNILPPAKAWKVRVTTACPKIKLKLGYSNTSTCIPDLYEEYYCKFNLNELNELITTQEQLPHHHTYQHQQHHRRHRTKKSPERKQSTFCRSSLTFIIFQDTHENRIHVAVQGTQHQKTTYFQDSVEALVPFIGIKHFCKNASCPRPVLVFV